MEGNVRHKNKISFSAIAMFFVILLFIESLLVYYNATWQPTVYSRFAKSMVRSSFSNMFFIVGYAGLLYLTLAIVIKKKVKLAQFFIVYILVMCSTLWTLLSIGSFSIASILGSQTPATVFFLMIFFLLGYDDDFWKKFNKALYYGGVIFSVLSFIDAIGFVNQYGFSYKLTNSPALTYLSYAIFMLAIYIAMNSNFRNRDIVLLYVSECLLLTVCLIALSRGWVIQVGILLIYTLYKLGSTSRNKLKNILIVCFIAIITWVVLSDSISTATSSLLDRVTEDTRSNQLEYFFEQVSWGQLVLGGGMGATYNFGSRSDYQFIDNQIIFIMFRYGVFACIFYLLFFLRPLFSCFNLKQSILCVPILMWMLALIGISTYFNVSNNILHLCMIIYVGRLSYYIDSKFEHVENRFVTYSTNKRIGIGSRNYWHV